MFSFVFLFADDVRVVCRLRRFMNHCVGVVDAVTINATVFTENIQQSVVVLAVCPVALKLQHGCNGGHWDCSGLNTSAYRRIVRKLRCGTAGILNDISIVSIIEHVEGGPCDEHLGPQTGDDDVLFADSLYRLAEAEIVS